MTARTADGVIEAWEWDGRTRHTGQSSRPALVCVQFHPELLYARGGHTTFLPLFRDLISRAR